VEAEPYFAMSPELVVAPDQFRDFLDDLRGSVVRRQLALKFGCKIGDHFFLRAPSPTCARRAGSSRT
jgi:hypothetical protein